MGEAINVIPMTEGAHNYFVSTQAPLIDSAWTLGALQQTYFGQQRTGDQLAEQIRNSLCFGLFRRDYAETGFPSHRDRQVGFARVVTDGVSFGWLCDFVIDPVLRGRGLGHQLLQTIVDHHALKTVTLTLGTRDAHAFYRKFGFTEGQTMLRRPG